MFIKKGRDITRENGFPAFYIYYKNKLPRLCLWRQGESWISQGTSGFWAENIESGVRIKVAVSANIQDSKGDGEILDLLEGICQKIS